MNRVLLRVLEVICGILLLPLFTVLGLIYGVLSMYDAYHAGICEALEKR